MVLFLLLLLLLLLLFICIIVVAVLHNERSCGHVLDLPTFTARMAIGSSRAILRAFLRIAGSGFRSLGSWSFYFGILLKLNGRRKNKMHPYD